MRIYPASPHKKFTVALVIVFALLSAFFLSIITILYVKDITPKKLLSKVGLASEKEEINYTLLSWNNSLDQLQYDADIVFIGDSLTIGENFQGYFADHKILNLGLSGDSLQGIYDRSKTISHFTPEKIFVQGGINSLAGESVENLAVLYDSMICDIISSNPTAKIYIQSVLPISNTEQYKLRTNENIIRFNEHLRSIADEYGLTYIDLYSVYVLSGEINPEYTKDGIHLKSEYKHLWLKTLEPFISD